MFRRAASSGTSTPSRRWRAPATLSAAVVVVALSAYTGAVAPERTGAREPTEIAAAGDPTVSSRPTPTPATARLSDPGGLGTPPGGPQPTRTSDPRGGGAETPSGAVTAAPVDGVTGEDDPAASPDPSSALTSTDEQTLRRYATDSWRSMTAMVDEQTGLVTDHIGMALDDPSTYTSPTNIAGYLWSTVVVRDLGILSSEESHERLAAALDAVARLERHAPSGMFYNWYSPQTGAKLTAWPDGKANGVEPIEPFLSTVDNGWLAAALRIVASADPALAAEVERISAPMDFAWFHDPTAADGAGLSRVGFWPDRPSDDCSEPADGSGAAVGVFVSCASYGTTVSEARIATYIGIANGQIPSSTYFATSRTGAASGSDAGWMRAPHGERRHYDGVPVLESTYAYDGMRIVPSWGGSMFEALMPDLLVPEAEWGPRSWAVNHRATVAAQKSRGFVDGGDGLWGFSPAADPSGGYGLYGVTGLSIGAVSHGPATASAQVDADGGGSATGVELLPPSLTHSPTPAGGPPGDEVVTPHASFLALPYDPRAALDNLARLESEPGMYGAGGFADAIDVESGRVASTHLSLDQSMVLAAIGNAVNDDALKGYLVGGEFEERVRPLVALQIFGSVID
ncbi:DUF3131 domain-containing protein [Labedella populi]|uniref:DUF3131 domain-containing protein n=1 Tax=Labedella populi TaxID=2498850 RepID=A0A3S4A002_9MICO|nr:glucoamylase family protein [Labedella populi]RWZ68760.1 DUF3131 domain-containing protein [Labedella populi]